VSRVPGPVTTDNNKQAKVKRAIAAPAIAWLHNDVVDDEDLADMQSVRLGGLSSFYIQEAQLLLTNRPTL